MCTTSKSNKQMPTRSVSELCCSSARVIECLPSLQIGASDRNGVRCRTWQSRWFILDMESRVPSLTHHAGCYAEFATIKTSLLAPIPDNISFDQAAALPLVCLTAMQVGDSFTGRSLGAFSVLSKCTSTACLNSITPNQDVICISLRLHGHTCPSHACSDVLHVCLLNVSQSWAPKLHHQFLHDTVTCLLMLYGHMVRPGCVLACINKPQWDHAQT